MSNVDLEKQLTDGPEEVSKALEDWRIKTLMREKVEALAYLEYKGIDKRTATEIRALVHADEKRYLAVLDELKAEAHYNLVNERLMAAKKLASLRTAF